MAREDSLLDDLLHPLTVEAFLADCWEREPLHISGKSDVIGRLIDFEDLEELIAFHGRSGQPPFSIARRSAIGPRHAADPLRAGREAYAAGQTLFVPEIHLRWPRFAAFCRALELRFRHPVGATLVFGPPGEQGLTPHFDAASVFALQVTGSKTWRVARPIREAPLFGDPSTDMAALPEPTVNYVLAPGDVLYVPMGFPHVAQSGPEPSLHVSIYINAIRARDVVSKALDRATASDPVFRRPLPPGLLASADAEATLAGLFADLAARLSAGFDPTSVHADLVADLLGRMPTLPVGLQAWEPPAPRAEDVVAQAPGVLAFASVGPEGATLVYPGGQTRGPSRIYQSLAFVAATPRFRIAEIPGLDPAGQLVLVERLLAEGVLRTEARGPASAQAKERTALMPSA